MGGAWFMGGAPVTVRRPISDLEIQEWVCEQYGFVPHPFWITDCKEIYLNEKQDQPIDARHKCPPEKHLMIRESFVHFGLLPE